MRSCLGLVTGIGVLAAASTGLAIQPTVTRAPSYWSCQDDLQSRIMVTYLDTDPPSVILSMGDNRVTATLQQSPSGAKYMASGGIVFWIKGQSALVEWPAGRAYSCASLD